MIHSIPKTHMAIPDDIRAIVEALLVAPIADEDGNCLQYFLGNYVDRGAVVLAQAILAERQRIIERLKEEADLTPCAEDAMVTRSNARLIEADFSYEEAERLAEKEEA